MEYFLYLTSYIKDNLLSIKKKIQLRKALSIKVDIGTGISEIFYDYNDLLDKIEIIDVQGPLEEESIEDLEEIVKSVLFGMMDNYENTDQIIEAINSNDTIDLRDDKQEEILENIENIEKKKRILEAQKDLLSQNINQDMKLSRKI